MQALNSLRPRAMVLRNRVVLRMFAACIVCGVAVAQSNMSGVNPQLNPEAGSYDVRDRTRGDIILRNARIGFSTAPYIDLKDVAADDVETNRKVTQYMSGKGECRVGDNGSLVFHKENAGELEVRFIPHHDPDYLEIAFSFRNLSGKPLRLRTVTVAEGVFMPGLDRSSMRMVPGNSGGDSTSLSCEKKISAENNLLCFFADPDKQRSFVAGGLTYADFRKFVNINQDRISLFCHDPVGKRVDPGQRYDSADRFYLDASIENPFDALEAYACVTERVRGIHLNYYAMPSVCMWFITVDHFGGDKEILNNSAGAVEEMKRIRNSGFLKYSPVAVRLVPDCYEQNNEQGWWDDEHWQMYGRKYICAVPVTADGGHYVKPYETTKKWAGKVRELGGIPLTYFQPGIRSEDYADAFPGHMLYNQSHKYILRNGKKVSVPHGLMGTRGFAGHPGYGKLLQESYDYTDPEFLAHWRQVNRNLHDGGVQGVFYDYPDRAYPDRGGLEDRYATAVQAYRNVYSVAREELGPDAYLQERLGPGSDATLDFVNSVRTEGDNNVLTPDAVAKAAMRWYKNRRLTNYDMDGKSLLGTGRQFSGGMSRMQRRATLTMSYAVSGRLLLTESFSRFSPEILHDLSRVFPFHATPLSARPLDAFAPANAVRTSSETGKKELMLKANADIKIRSVKGTPRGSTAGTMPVGDWEILNGTKEGGKICFLKDGTWTSPWPDWHGIWSVNDAGALSMTSKGSNRHPIRVEDVKSDHLPPRCPGVYDFPVSRDWHQLVLFAAEKTSFSVPLSGETAFGAIGLDSARDYYVYDFWNNTYVGKLPGDSSIRQELEQGEARMLSVHAVASNPQWISTDRHLMQGYVDLVGKPVWDAENRSLSGTSAVVGGEPYRVTIALNGYNALSCKVEGADGRIDKRDEAELADIVIEANQDMNAKWTVMFKPVLTEIQRREGKRSSRAINNKGD